jgi:hypothetical protein
MARSGWIAFFLSVVPGAGHLYLNKLVRAAAYFFLFFAPLGIGFMLSILAHEDEPFLFGLLLSACVWFVNKIDIILTVAMEKQQEISAAGHLSMTSYEQRFENEKNAVLLWSILCPGAGHFYIGLTMRGLTIFFGFFGVAAMTAFVTALTGEIGFAVLLGILPFIWVSGLADALHLVNRKQNGELLFEPGGDLQPIFIGGNQRNRAVALMLSVIPGASHLYLGLQQRGLQLIAAFLFAIYTAETLRLSVFFLLIPVVWLYSFIDALKQISRSSQRQEPEADPLYGIWNPKGLGIGLILLGIFVLYNEILHPFLFRMLASHFELGGRYAEYVRIAAVAGCLIFAGAKLLPKGEQKDIHQV